MEYGLTDFVFHYEDPWNEGNSRAQRAGLEAIVASPDAPINSATQAELWLVLYYPRYANRVASTPQIVP